MRNSPLKRSGIARVNEGSHSFTSTYTLIHKWNEPYLPLLPTTDNRQTTDREPLIFGPCMLWLNGWMDWDANSYGGRPWPSRRCVRWGPRSPQRGTPPVMAHALWPNGCMNHDATWYGGRPRTRPHCVTCGCSCPLKRAQHPPPIFGPCLLWPYGWMDQDATW